MNLRLKPEEQIADMRTISENVATYLDDEEYILNNSIIREFIGGSIILD